MAWCTWSSSAERKFGRITEDWAEIFILPLIYIKEITLYFHRFEEPILIFLVLKICFLELIFCCPKFNIFNNLRSKINIEKTEWKIYSPVTRRDQGEKVNRILFDPSFDSSLKYIFYFFDDYIFLNRNRNSIGCVSNISIPLQKFSWSGFQIKGSDHDLLNTSIKSRCRDTCV